MADFSPVEETLLSGITDNRLRSSLAQIREASEDIWTPEQRIVRDFTDHGISHSVRISKYANELLQANLGRKLSDIESYTLMAGIYLHDIGMQCDVTKYPKIIISLKNLKGDDVKILARNVSEYSLYEQMIIRKNHHLLSAAWIEHAYKTGESRLGLAIKTIPEYLIGDIMDVCKYHSTLLISDCPKRFKFKISERKQFIAALLRFCDELDISSNRVSIDTVKDFSIDPQNAIYWWLHNRTIVNVDGNVVTIIIRLNPFDTSHYGDLVYYSFINEFHLKNQSIISVLKENGLPATISIDSSIKIDEVAESLPDEIASEILIIYQENYDELTQKLETILIAAFDLTERETEVLLAFVNGKLYGRRKIGDELGITMNTLKTYIRKIIRKMKVPTMNEAVKKASNILRVIQ